MTKGEYFAMKGLHTSSPAFNPDDELDDDFKNAIDALVEPRPIEEVVNDFASGLADINRRFKERIGGV